MSHLYPHKESRKHRRSDCRKGRHQYGQAQKIGAGMRRQVCEVCGAVSIDLTAAEELTAPLANEQKSIVAEVHRR